MTGRNDCSTAQSPTLHPGQRYLSIIAHVPGTLRERLTDYKRSVGMHREADLSTHVTVYVSELRDEHENDWRSEALAASLRGIGAVQASATGVQTFRPAADVEYLEVGAGTEEFIALHRACVQQLGQWATPFPYVPHITLGRSLTSEQVQQARKLFETLTDEERSFTIDTLHVYAYDGADWEPLGALALTDAPEYS